MNNSTQNLLSVTASINKNVGDIIAINEKKLQENRDNKNKNHGIERIEELKRQGNIQEAAAVFSQEGLETFAKILLNSLESCIESKIKVMFNDLIAETMQGILKGISVSTIPDFNIENITKNVMDRYKNNMISSLFESPVNENPEQSKSTDIVPHKRRGRRSNVNYDEIMLVIESIPSPFKASTLEHHLKELGINFGVNITSVANALIQKGLITRVKFGVYAMNEE